MTPAELLAATAADMRKVAEAASDAPWFYNTYSAVFSGPLTQTYDAWLDPIVDAGHSVERYGACVTCGDWREQPSGRSPGLGDGCQHFAEDYRREPLVAKVLASAGDTAHGRHEADAEHIAAWNPDVTQWVAAWLDEEAYRYAKPDNAWQVPFHVNQGIELPMLKICEAWWKSRGREPVAP